MVAHYQRVLPPEQFRALIADIRDVYGKYMAAFAKSEPGAARAVLAHEMITAAMKNSTGSEKPSCAKGCGACCHLEVEITRDEAELLANVVERGFELDRERLRVQASRERMSREWATAPKHLNRCVFLGSDQACLVYEFRPSICRKVLVTNNPVECANPDGKPTPILFPLAEIALSALTSLPGNESASLSKNLLAALDRRKKGRPHLFTDERPAAGLPVVDQDSDPVLEV